MKYSLDSNAIIALLKLDAEFLGWMQRHRPEEFFLSSIVAHELYYGAFKSIRCAASLADLQALPFSVLDLDLDDARQAGKVRAQLESRGTPIGYCDLLIAGQALARDLIVVTRNVQEFQRVAGLRWENW